MIKIQGIYKIVNCVTNKIYIGQSSNIYNRFKEHEYNITRNTSHPLYNSFRKYGIGNFEFIVLEEIDNVLLLDQREQYWLDYYKSYDREYGYNLRLKAESFRGYKRSEENKKKNSESNKGRIPWNKGKKIGEQSEETKRKKSESMKQKWKDINYRNKCIKSKNNAAEKISSSVKKLWDSAEYRNKMLPIVSDNLKIARNKLILKNISSN